MSSLRVLTAPRARGLYRAELAWGAKLGVFAELRLKSFHDVTALVRSVRGLQRFETLCGSWCESTHSTLFIDSPERRRGRAVCSGHTDFSFRREGTRHGKSGYTRHFVCMLPDVTAEQRSVAAWLLTLPLSIVSGTTRSFVYEGGYFWAPG